VLALLSASPVCATQALHAAPSEATYSERFDVSPPLSALAVTVSATRPSALTAPLLSLEGASSDDNSELLSLRVVPPDVAMDVGPDHIVEMVNLLLTIWDKDGNRLAGPLPTRTLWAGFGGACEQDTAQRPTVMYDHLADRWILVHSAFPTSLCVAASQTPDPSGAYTRYLFAAPDSELPKLGVWPAQDAYLLTYSVFGSTPVAARAGALERAAILNGQPARMVLVALSVSGQPIDGVLPADLDGFTPAPPGAPGTFLGHLDGPDQLALFELSVDWTNAGSATLSGPNLLGVDPFDGDLCGDGSRCVPQPGTATRLDARPGWMMNRLQYRSFGAHQTLVANHTVDADGSDHAGVRWYELRNTGAGWFVQQQGTHAPDAEHRFMGSAAMNGNGDIALGYSVSSGSVNPSIRVAGRLAGDALGQMTVAETTLIAGTGSQQGASRWGDYTTMTVDPLDDETFYYAGEYVRETGSFRWNTRIGAFRLSPSNPAEMTQELIARVDALPSSSFRQPNQRTALLGKLEEVLAAIEGGTRCDLCRAVRKLEHDILPKTDGESPPPDWVTEPAAQAELEAQILALIAALLGEAGGCGDC
jgi:hypothetical protein